MAFTLRLILLEKQTLSHNEEEWWVVPGSVPRDGKPSARKSGKTLQSLPNAHTRDLVDESRLNHFSDGC